VGGILVHLDTTADLTGTITLVVSGVIPERAVLKQGFKVVSRTPMLYDFPVSDLIDIHAVNGNRFVRWFYPAIKADMSASRNDPGCDMVTFGNLADNCHVEVRIGRSNSPYVRLRAFDITRCDEVRDPVQITRVDDLFDVTSDERLLITIH
jgi:hypothetical protein